MSSQVDRLASRCDRLPRGRERNVEGLRRLGVLDMVGLSRPRVRREKILGLAVVLVALLGSTTVAAERFKEVVVYKPEHDGEWKLNCSREKSRMVRKVLNELIFPHMARAKANFTMSCPLAPQRDLYYEHEIHKQKFRSSYWKSLYSNKIFKSEFFIDQHMENRHMDKIPPTADVCLGETCSVFLCDAYALDHYEQMGRNLRMKSQFARKPCEAGAMASAQSECRGLLDACFGDLDPKLFVFFKRNVCDMLTCRDFHR